MEIDWNHRNEFALDSHRKRPALFTHGSADGAAPPSHVIASRQFHEGEGQGAGSVRHLWSGGNHGV